MRTRCMRDAKHRCCCHYSHLECITYSYLLYYAGGNRAFSKNTAHKDHKCQIVTASKYLVVAVSVHAEVR